ncbi:hypothetical protein [Flavobacterium sp.]|uniref:hypothetical protein n=1 Tax=Flavobacterium sp. TaxID=239 RepID=UPI0037534884
MKKLIPLLSAILLLNSCQKEQKSTSLNDEKNQTEKLKTEDLETNEEENAKKWILKTIDSYFKEDFPTMNGITTKSYEEYKTEATNVDLDTDEALTLEDFEKKWKDKYDTKYAGIGSGFLISGQDWGKIEVINCKSLKSTIENEYLFDVTLSDTHIKIDYLREIKVIKSEDTFLISDVKEFNKF